MRKLATFFVIGVFALVHALGCSTTESDPDATSTGSTNSETSTASGSGGGGALVTPELPTAPGDHSLEVGWEGADRTVIVHIPASYDPKSPAPLVIALHGGNGSAPGFREQRQGLVDGAETAGVVVVFPEGVTDNGTAHVWNSWDKAETTADDVGFIVALRAWLVDGLALDASKVFLSGFSNGAAMTQRVAAEHPELLAGAAAICHSTGLIEPADEPLCGACTEVCDPKCTQVNQGSNYSIPTPKAPINLLVIRGGKDDKVCPAGGCSAKGKIAESVETQADFWLTANGCDKNMVDEQKMGSVTLRKYDSCSDGKTLQLAVDTELGHNWAAGLDEPVLSFFMDLK